MSRQVVTQILYDPKWPEYEPGTEIGFADGTAALIVERIMTAEELEARDQIQRIMWRMFPAAVRRSERRNGGSHRN